MLLFWIRYNAPSHLSLASQHPIAINLISISGLCRPFLSLSHRQLVVQVRENPEPNKEEIKKQKSLCYSQITTRSNIPLTGKPKEQCSFLVHYRLRRAPISIPLPPSRLFAITTSQRQGGEDY